VSERITALALRLKTAPATVIYGARPAELIEALEVLDPETEVVDWRGAAADAEALAACFERARVVVLLLGPSLESSHRKVFKDFLGGRFGLGQGARLLALTPGSPDAELDRVVESRLFGETALEEI
jgi:hypothetical protein